MSTAVDRRRYARHLTLPEVGEVREGDGPDEGPAWLSEALREEASREVTAGALEALARLREALEPR